MRFGEQLLLIFALAMDGFAASICMGVSLPNGGQALWAAALVTAFHAAMFAAGYLVGALCTPVAAAAPWAGALLLAAMGAHMLLDALRATDDGGGNFNLRHAAALGFSTSVDAMTTGFSFALMAVALAVPLGMVALVMGVLSLGGVCAGRHLGRRFRRLARLGGGALLLAMGLKNLLVLV